MIGADTYYVVYKLKEAQIFVIFMKNQKFQAIKEARPETNPKTVI